MLGDSDGDELEIDGLAGEVVFHYTPESTLRLVHCTVDLGDMARY